MSTSRTERVVTIREHNITPDNQKTENEVEVKSVKEGEEPPKEDKDVFKEADFIMYEE